MKTLIKYIFTIPHQTKCTDWCDYLKLREKVGAAKRRRDKSLTDISLERIEFSYTSNRSPVRVIPDACYNALPLIQNPERRHCITNGCIMDDKSYERLIEHEPKYCPEFKHHQSCGNAKCWSQISNCCYVIHHNKYISLERQLHEFWQGRMAQRINARMSK